MIKVASTQFCGRSTVTSWCQVSACELQPFSCHDLANDIFSQTAKTVFSHLNNRNFSIFHFMFTLGPLTASQKTSFANAQKFLEHPCFDNIQTFKQWFQENHRKSLEVAGMFLENICQSKQDKKSHTYWPKMLVCIINHWASEGQPTEAFFSGRCSLRGMAVLVGRAK